MTGRRSVFIVLIGALLLLALASISGQPAAESPGQDDALSPADAAGQVFCIASSFFHLDRDPRWIDAPFTSAIVYTLPKTLPSFPVSRAPPA